MNRIKEITRKKCNTYFCFHLHVARGAAESLAEPDGEPVDDLDAGDEAEAEEEAEEAADLRDEVYGGHAEGALELENCRLLGNRLGGSLGQVTDLYKD